jgi:hypothetical protein
LTVPIQQTLQRCHVDVVQQEEAFLVVFVAWSPTPMAPLYGGHIQLVIRAMLTRSFFTI